MPSFPCLGQTSISHLTLHLSKVLASISVDIAAIDIGLPIDPELSINKETTVSLKFVLLSCLAQRWLDLTLLVRALRRLISLPQGQISKFYFVWPAAFSEVCLPDEIQLL